MQKKICKTCSKTFQSSKSGDDVMCYDCALEYVTNGLPPEEGDFNTAKIISGTMTPQEREWLQRDLEAVERGISHFEPLDEDDYLYEEEDNLNQDLSSF